MKGDDKIKRLGGQRKIKFLRIFKQQQAAGLRDDSQARGTFTRPLAELDSHEQLSTDKMAEIIFYFGRKWQAKNLHISEKSSTFAA